MVNVIEKDIIDILVNNDFNLDAIKEVSECLYLNLKADNYELCIDSNVAACLVSYQNTIYKLYCLAKYGSPKIKKLTLDEKTQLCLKFKIKKGSTEYQAYLREITNMFETLPPEHRIWAVIILFLTAFGGISAFFYWKYKEDKLQQSTLIKEQDNNRLAIEKLAEIAQQNTLAYQAATLAFDEEKSRVKELSQADGAFKINGDTYTQKEIANIVRLYSQKNEVQGKSYNKNGNFIVSSIDVEAPYKITLKDSDGRYNALYDPKFFNKKLFDRILLDLQQNKTVFVTAEINIYEENERKEIKLLTIK